MSFCGSREGSLSVGEGVLQNRCFVDVLNIIPHGCFLLYSIIILVVWRESVFGKMKVKTWVHFQGHCARWIATLILVMCNCVEIAEGFVSDYLDPDDPNYHVIIPPCISLVCTLVTIIYYHNVEMWNSPRFLLALLPYWTIALALKFTKALSLYRNDIRYNDMRLWLTWIVVFLYFTLLVIELNVLRSQKYAFFKKSRRVRPPEELEHTRYYASFANFLSRATFWWMNEILIEGYKSPLEAEQLGNLPKSEKSVTQFLELQRAFEEERAKAARENQEPSMHKVYLNAFWPVLVLAAVFRLLGDLLAFVGPSCIERIVDFAYEELEKKNPSILKLNSTPTVVSYSVSNTTESNTVVMDTTQTPAKFFVTVDGFLSNGYGLCIVLFVCTLLQHTFLHNHHYLVIRQGIRLRSALQAMIYNKTLSLSGLVITSGKSTVGQIMNHMTMDTNFLMMFLFFIHYLWATPLQVIIALTLMYFKLGVSAVVGGVLIILCAPVQIFVGRGMSNMQKKVMQQADKRVKRCNEMIQGIKVIKLLAWEAFFCRSISEARTKELKFLFINAIFRALFTFVGTAVPAMATMLTFVLYPYIESEPMTAGKALSTLALFNILTIPLILFTLFTTSFISANVSCKRLVKFFLAEEIEGASVRETLLSHGMFGDQDFENIKMQPVIGFTSRKSSPALFWKDDALGGSTSSLSSTLSHHTPFHSRQNSSVSLLDFSDTSKRHSHPTSIALSVGDTSDQRRRRHTSGMSTDDEDDRNTEQQFVVEVSNGTFSWDLEKKELALKDISVKIPARKLTIIVGPVGSGKSSLLSAILDEMITITGDVAWCRNPSVAYVGQKPWLMNMSLRDNILFGQTFLWKRYQKVIEACSLQQDIDTLPAGDMTEIGEKGINLSGGQKQRVNIARALYSHADTIIMDDPLSALDAHVGRHVFDEVILKKLLRRKKTVIFVTHQLQYLNYAHYILVMKDGTIQCQGKLSEVKKIDPDLYESWRKALKEAKSAEAARTKDSESGTDGTIDHLPARQISIQSQTAVDNATDDQQTATSVPLVIRAPSETERDRKLEQVNEDKEEEEEPKETDKVITGKLVKKEHREVGAVKLHVYLYHLKACRLPFVLGVLLLLLLNQALLVSTNFWISIWASQSTVFADRKKLAPVNSTEVFDNSPYIQVYILLSVSAVIVTLLSGFALHFTGICGAKNLHSTMLNQVIRVPIRFFDTNPSGRIINRFSSDIASIDQKIPGTWDAFLRCLLATLAAIVVNCIGTPYFLFAAVPLIVLYYCMQRFYRATARELQRLDSVTKSPIFTHFSETLSGLQTIRAYRAQSRFQQKALTSIDANVVPFLFNQTANRWLGIRLDYMGAVLVFAAALASLSAGLAGQTNPAFIGLCIAYGLMVSNYLNWIVRNSSELEMMMNAVERVDEYSRLETEPYTVDWETSKCAIQKNSPDKKTNGVEATWPSKGIIEFRDVSLSYDAKLDPVVTGLSFSINSGEKVGICGRTGSGKSSLTLSLFRMIDIRNGQIIIDARDIAQVKLPELRSQLAIIPQDPILFTGTIRYNLDPTESMSDDSLWSALESVQLKDTIEALPNKLDSSVSEGGENFSVGQKQLFCLARAFLRDNKILVLDEATASIDLETDIQLQQVIGTVFKTKTVITIAHRISTIMQYDRVMVMESGQILEFDTPHALMNNEDSHFAGLVKQSQSKSASL